MSLPLERVNSSIGSAITHINDLITDRNSSFIKERILKSLFTAQTIIISYIENIRLVRKHKRKNHKKNKELKAKIFNHEDEDERRTKFGGNQNDMFSNFSKLTLTKQKEEELSKLLRL
jgi:hypothetical protein